MHKVILIILYSLSYSLEEVSRSEQICTALEKMVAPTMLALATSMQHLTFSAIVGCKQA